MLHPVLIRLGEVEIRTHDVCVALGVLTAGAVFLAQVRRRAVRGHPVDDRIWIVVAGALVGGALLSRLGTWLQHLDPRTNATLVEQWLYGNRSILSGLVGAYVGALVAKRLCGYPERTGDLFAPSVALGMAVGRVGCLLAERPGALGVNDGEIGAVVKRALDTPYVGGVSIQPQFGSGRSGPIDPLDRLTHTGVLARLGPQTGDLVTWRDLTALPCSHPHCCSVGYLLRDDAGQWRSLTALVGHERLLTFLDVAPDAVANRIADTELALRAAVKESLLGLLSEQSSLSHPKVGDLWRDICENCDLGISTLTALASSALPGGRARLRKLLGERVKRVTVKPFMDVHTMIEERLAQCCVHVATRSDAGDHQCAPFCAVQAWPALSVQRLPGPRS